MKKIKLLSLLAGLFIATSLWADPAVAVNGKLPGAFSVSATKQVCFSQGNLQYNSNTQTWQFAAQQYEYIGGKSQWNSLPRTGNNYITTTGIPDNSGIVDLFSWVGQSSEYNTGLPQYGIVIDESDDPATTAFGTVVDESLKYDWGTLMGNDWFTMSSAEWNYLLNERSITSGIRYAKGTVNDATGIILLPDDWNTSNFALSNTNDRTAAFTSNTISSSDWASQLEAHGAVFLPAAGCRVTSVNALGEEGNYWTSSSAPSSTEDYKVHHNAYELTFYASTVNPQYRIQRYWGFSVRLVSETTPAPVVVTIDVPTHQDPLNSQWYYTTFYHSTQNYALTNDGTEAFVADLSGTDLVLTKIAEGTQVIPANTGVILRKSNSADPVVLAPTDAAGVSFTANNDLEGVDVQTDLTDINGLTQSNCYILSGQSDDQSVVGVGFYRINKTYLKEHKAYVKYAGTQNNAPKRMRFVFNEEQTATGVENVQDDNVQSTKVLENGVLYIIKNGVRYNAQGQKVK